MNLADTIKKQTDRILRQRQLDGSATKTVVGNPTGPPAVTEPNANLEAHKVADDHANYLTESRHNSLDHSGLPGIPEAEAFTESAHSYTDHTGLPGVGSGGGVDPFYQGAHSGLSFAYGAGVVRADNVVVQVAAGTVALTDDADNYIEVTTAGGVSANTTGYISGRIPLYKAITGNGAITSVQDDRCFFNVGGGGSGGFSIGWNPVMLEIGFTVTTVDAPV